MTKKTDKALTVYDRLKSPTMMAVLKKVFPKNMELERYMSVAVNSAQKALAKKNDIIPSSLIHAVYTGASLGLSFDPLAKEAYLVPFRSREAGGTMVTFIIGYKGLQRLCRNAGMKSMRAILVYEKDDFEYYEDINGVKFKHEPEIIEDRGKLRCIVTVATMKDGEKDIAMMTSEKIQKIRNTAKSKDIWNAWPEEMGRKTAERAHCGQLPQSAENEELQRAVYISEMEDAGKPVLDIPEELRDVVDGDYENIVNNINNPKPKSTKPEITQPVEEIKETNQFVSSLMGLGLSKEKLESTIEAEFGYRSLESIPESAQSRILDFFVGEK